MKTSKRIETDAGKSDGTLYAWGRHHSSRLCGSPETALIEGFSERCIATAISETDETFERADLATPTVSMACSSPTAKPTAPKVDAFGDAIERQHGTSDYRRLFSLTLPSVR